MKARGLSFSLHSTLKNRNSIPVLPYAAIKKRVMGEEYHVSLVFVGDRRSHSLNKRYRVVDKPANVLAFPLEKNIGEIFINPRAAKRDAPRFGISTEKLIGYFFIHGLLHLSRYRHGSRMEKREQELRAEFRLL